MKTKVLRVVSRCCCLLCRLLCCPCCCCSWCCCFFLVAWLTLFVAAHDLKVPSLSVRCCLCLCLCRCWCRCYCCCCCCCCGVSCNSKLLYTVAMTMGMPALHATCRKRREIFCLAYKQLKNCLQFAIAVAVAVPVDVAVAAGNDAEAYQKLKRRTVKKSNKNPLKMHNFHLTTPLAGIC